MSQFTLNLAPERRVWKVSELTARIRGLLEAEFRSAWVEGEISNCREAQSGHLYFTLKDEAAQIRCVCFRSQARLLKFKPEDGLHVTVRGSLSVYEQRGEYQIYVEHVEPVGLGALQLAFEQLKQRLEAEGLFDPARKKPLPVLPGRIGIITSPAGAAIRDILRILRRRFPNAHVLVYPARVQGEGAAQDIVHGLRYLDEKKLADVIILTRGGGSLEDLWAFNEESVARAVAACSVPVISAVGHETDVTISDFVADVRASTPSNAAEMVVRTRQEFDSHLRNTEQRLTELARYRLLVWQRQVQELAAHRGFRRLEVLVRQRRQRLDEAAGQLAQLLRARLERAHRRLSAAQARVASFDLRARMAAMRARTEQRWSELRARMEALLVARRRQLERLMTQLDERSPLRVLDRGYAIAYDAAGNVLRAAAAVQTGDEVGVKLRRGRLKARVIQKDELA
jgi:exodeoxyribonuclease VII large subunit